MTRMIKVSHKAIVDGKIVIEQGTPFTQADMQNICAEYDARIMNVQSIRRTRYVGLSEVRENITEYKFESSLRDKTGYQFGVS